MSSLDTTFEILTHHSSPSAGEVLCVGATSNDPSTKLRSVKAIAHRRDAKTLNWLVNRFDKFREVMLSGLLDETGHLDSGYLGKAVVRQLKKASWNQAVGLRLINMAECFNQADALESLIQISLEHDDSLIRAAAAEVVLSLSASLSKSVRHRSDGKRLDPDAERYRQRMAEALGHAVEQYHVHRNNDLLDAFLVISDWNDVLLQRLLADESPTQETLVRRLKNSEHQSVLHLLAGFVRRRKIPGAVVGVLLRRHDAMFCEALLETIGDQPSPVVSINLKEYGLPDCLRGGESFMRSLGSDRDIAMCHAYSLAMPHEPEVIHMVLAMLQRNEEGAIRAAETCLKRVDAPSLEFWISILEAALDDESPEEAGGDASIADRATMMMNSLIQLTDHPEKLLSQSAQRLLTHLNTAETLPVFADLDPEVGKRLGQVLMGADETTLDVIRQGLRHAVLQNRLDAIGFAETLGLIDLMIEPLESIAKNDHQIAKMRTAQALGHGHGTQSEVLLREMCSMQKGSLRDAAIESMEMRGLTL
ncbi:hypothetical protein [Rhodopirellula halodulae]|uniref:hypothetical protein n=1 Tax=Rhodopirellula halodulae TaxID=2894198 RepID=UPI001E3F5499|nr:hypothetical protein [Rhodopirellula sp. JC737]MCC9656578.1 hypothetical protein [Rhodopirellula sp. JC737]